MIKKAILWDWWAGVGESIVVGTLSESGGFFIGSEAYSGANSIPPDAKVATSVLTLPSSFQVGEDVTFSVSGYYSPSGRSAGSHIYKLYGGSSKASAALIYSGTATTYELTASEVNKYLLLEVTLIDSNGVQSLTNAISAFTATVVSSDSAIFQNAIHRYRWDSILQSGGAAAGVGDPAYEWQDISSGGTDNLVYSGTPTVPNVTSGYVEIGTSNDIEWVNNSLTAISQPYEVWVVMENLSGNDFNLFMQGTGFQLQDNGANLRIIAGSTAQFTGGSPPDGTQVILRCVVDGSSTELWQDGTENAASPLDAGTSNITVFKIGNNGAGANWRCSEIIIFDENTDAYAAAVLSELETDYGL